MAVPIWVSGNAVAQKGCASQTRRQRLVILVTAIVLWFLTKEVMLGLIAIGAAYRMFTKDAAPEH